MRNCEMFSQCRGDIAVLIKPLYYKPTQPRLRFDLEKLNDPIMMSAFQASIGGRFAPLEKKKRGEPEGAKDYRDIKRKIRTEMKMAKETWIQGKCQEVEACIRKNNSKKAFPLVKDLTTEKQGKSTTIQHKSRKCLTEKNEILNRWTEYCSDLYNYETDGTQ